MELRQLRSFAILAEELHFGRAARRLHIVQPALSKQLKTLEEDVGVALVRRNRRGVSLTEAGRLFLVETVQALSRIDQAVEVARRSALGKTGRVRIGYSASAVHSGILKAALERIGSRMPEIDIVLERVDPWRQASRLVAGEVDLVFGPRPVEDLPPELEARTLAEFVVEVALARHHPLAGNDSIRPEDISNEVFIEYAESEMEARAVVISLVGIEPKAVIARSDPLDVLALVQSGRGVCALPSILTVPTFPMIVYRKVDHASRSELVLLARRDGMDQRVLNAMETIAGLQAFGHASQRVRP